MLKTFLDPVYTYIYHHPLVIRLTIMHLNTCKQGLDKMRTGKTTKERKKYDMTQGKKRQNEQRWGEKWQENMRQEKDKKNTDKTRLNALPLCGNKIKFLIIAVVNLFNKWFQTDFIFMLANSPSQSATQEVEIDWPWISDGPPYQPWTSVLQMAAICNSRWTFLP